jgi:hypothetical protein
MGKRPSYKPAYTSSGLRIPSRNASPSPSRTVSPSPSRSETPQFGAAGKGEACPTCPWRDTQKQTGLRSNAGHAPPAPRPAPKIDRSASASPSAGMMKSKLVDLSLSVHDAVPPFPLPCVLRACACPCPSPCVRVLYSLPACLCLSPVSRRILGQPRSAYRTTVGTARGMPFADPCRTAQGGHARTPGSESPVHACPPLSRRNVDTR